MSIRQAQRDGKRRQNNLRCMLCKLRREGKLDDPQRALEALTKRNIPVREKGGFGCTVLVLPVMELTYDRMGKLSWQAYQKSRAVAEQVQEPLFPPSAA